MAKQLFTAADIRKLVNSNHSSFLILGKDDIVTPEAIDVAKENRIELIREVNDVPNFTSSLPLNNKFPAPTLPPLKVVLGSSVIMDPFGNDIAEPGTNVRLKDVISSSDGSPMCTGYMALDKGVFPWKLSYDEIDIIIEGTLKITRGDICVNGNPGDVIFIPKDSEITFSTEDKVRFVYVAYPANWNEAI